MVGSGRRVMSNVQLMHRKMYKTDVTRYRVYGDRCVYCGEAATDRDHFPPRPYCCGYLLPACESCNNTAASWHPFNFE